MDKLEVYDKGIVRYWREMGTLRMVFDSSLNPVEALTVLEQALKDMVLPSGPKVAPGGVALSSWGPVVTIHGIASPAEAEKTLDDLGQTLAAAGGFGSLRPLPYQAVPIGNPDVAVYGFTAGICIEGHPDPSEPMKWVSQPQTMSAIVEKAIQWCILPDGSYYVSSGWSTVQCTLEQGRDLLATSMSADLLSTRLVCATDEGHIRSVVFGYTGTVFFARVDPEGAWEIAVSDLADVLASLSGHINYGAVKVAQLTVESWDWFIDNDWPPRPYLMRGKSETGRSIVETHVPDAFGVQLLGPRHRIPSSKRWVQRQVSGRHVLLVHRDLASWFPGHLPDETTLEKARDDFMPMLLTNDIADAAWKERWAAAPTPVWPPRP